MSVRRLATGILAVPLLLSACGGGDDSVADPPISSAPTSSATGTPPRESAEHFIRRWADAEQAMENTGRTTLYARMTPGCAACASLIKDVKRFYSAGGFIRWGGLRVISIRRSHDNPDGTTTYVVQTDSTPTKYRESSSGPVRRIKGGLTKEQVSLKRIGGELVVVARARLSQ
jgi:hypothetical protein